MSDFNNTTDIECSYYLDLWGPYAFYFPICSSISANDGSIPYDDTIASVTVKAYAGKVTKKSTLSAETPITDLIDPSYAPNVSLSGDVVNIKLQYPVVTSFKGQKATLIFEITLDSGGKKDFYFHYVRIR